MIHNRCWSLSWKPGGDHGHGPPFFFLWVLSLLSSLLWLPFHPVCCSSLQPHAPPSGLLFQSPTTCSSIRSAVPLISLVCSTLGLVLSSVISLVCSSPPSSLWSAPPLVWSSPLSSLWSAPLLRHLSGLLHSWSGPVSLCSSVISLVWSSPLSSLWSGPAPPLQMIHCGDLAGFEPGTSGIVCQCSSR